MAFAFFRRRQKTVIIVMVILMVSFLVGFQGFSMFLQKKPGKKVLGRFEDGPKLRQQELQVIDRDMRLLARSGLIDGMLDSIFRVNETRYLIIDDMRANGPLMAYALLLHEAQPYGPVTAADVDSYLSQTLSDADFQAIRARLRSDGMPESALRGAVADMILLNRAFASARALTPPSEPELQALYRDLSEEVAFEYIAIPADQFLASDQIPQPTDEEIGAHFAAYADMAPGNFSEENPFGFGYRMPNQVSVAYLRVDADPLRYAVSPTTAEMRAFYKKNQEAFMTPAELDDEGNVITPAGPIAFVDAYDQLIDACRPEATRKTVRRILAHAEDLVAQFDAAPVADFPNAYAYAMATMVQPAEGILQRAVTLDVTDKPLDQVLLMLAQLVDIQGISYPLVSEEGKGIAVDAPVSLSGEMTLGEALAALARQLDQQVLTWVQCDGLSGTSAILFADSPISTFPVSMGELPLVSKSVLSGHPLLGEANCRSEDGGSLVAAAFTEGVFAENALAAIKQEDYSRMMLSGGGEGELVWRLTDARASYSPALDAVRQQVIEDLRLDEAMFQARAYAQGLVPALARENMVQLAEDEGLVAITTDLAARKGWFPDMGWLYWNRVSGLDVSSNYALSGFYEDVMGLAQAGVSDSGLGTFLRTGVVRVPAARQVCLVRVLEYSPADASEYQVTKPELIMFLMQQRMAMELQSWVALEAVQERVGFIPE